MTELARYVIVFLHVLGNPSMEVRSEGVFADKAARERRVEVMNRRRSTLWYHACAEVK